MAGNIRKYRERNVRFRGNTKDGLAQDALVRLEIEARRAAAPRSIEFIKTISTSLDLCPAVLPRCYQLSLSLSLSRFLATVLLTRSLSRGIA